MYHVLCYINFVSLSVPPLCLCLSVSLCVSFTKIINTIVPSLIYPSWLQITLASLLSQWSSHIVPYSPSPLHTSTRPSWGAWPPESLTSPGEQVKPVAKRERGRERQRERERGEGGIGNTTTVCVCMYVQFYKCIHPCMYASHYSTCSIHTHVHMYVHVYVHVHVHTCTLIVCETSLATTTFNTYVT